MEDKMAVIGHNEPLVMRASELVATANRWATERPEITDDQTGDDCDSFLTQIKEILAAYEEARKAEREPLLEAGKEIQSRYAVLVAPLQKVREILKPRLSAWNKLKQKRLDEEAAAKRKEAEEAERVAAAKQKTADEAMKTEGSDAIGAAVVADEAAKEAEDLAKQAVVAGRQKASTKGDLSARSTGLRKTWFAELTNVNKALRYYGYREEVKELMVKLASAEARSGVREVPGFNITYRED